MAGIINFDGAPVLPVEVDRLLAPTRHRARRGPKVLCADNAGFGFLLEPTTPEATFEHVPLSLDDPPVLFVADARIDNRPELIHRLSMDRADASRRADGDFILEAYRRWGPGFVTRIVGVFAAVFWNRSTHQVLLTRDPMGIRPLFYHLTRRRLVFGTEVRNVLADHQVPRDLDDLMVARFMDSSYVRERERTFYARVQRVPGAHLLQVDAPGATLRRSRYWNPERRNPLAYGTDQEYEQAFREVLQEAVRSRLRAPDGRIGATLSGGLDSTTVACSASRLLQQTGARLTTFSAVFPSLPPAHLAAIDEREYVGAVLARGGMDPRYVRADLRSPMTDVELLLDTVGQPYHGLSIFLHWLIYQEAASAGIGIVLTGLDGDTAVSHGWERLAYQLATRRWEGFSHELDMLAGAQGIDRMVLVENFVHPYLAQLVRSGRLATFARAVHFAARTYGQSALRLYWRHLLEPAMAPWSRRARLKRAEESFWSDFLRPEFRRRAEAAGYAVDRHRDRLMTDPWEHHFRSLTSGAWQTVAETDDAVSAHCGIESRSPLFDRRLLEFCIRLPMEFKLRNGWGRYVLRSATVGIVPDEVRWRSSKSDLSPHFYLGLATTEAWRLRRSIVDEPRRIEEYFNLRALRTSLGRFLAAPLTRMWDGSAVYHAVMVDEWLRRRG